MKNSQNAGFNSWYKKNKLNEQEDVFNGDEDNYHTSTNPINIIALQTQSGDLNLYFVADLDEGMRSVDTGGNVKAYAIRVDSLDDSRISISNDGEIMVEGGEVVGSM